jgi:hypothetical protein
MSFIITLDAALNKSNRPHAFRFSPKKIQSPGTPHCFVFSSVPSAACAVERVVMMMALTTGLVAVPAGCCFSSISSFY